MSKDKSGKKDKFKKHDLFALMLDQSAAFRDMVAHFQKVWGPLGISESAQPVAAKIPAAKAAKAEKPAKATRKASKKVATASKKAKPVTTAKSTEATRKTAAKKTPIAKKAKPVVTRKPATKAGKKKNAPGK